MSIQPKTDSLFNYTDLCRFRRFPKIKDLMFSTSLRMLDVNANGIGSCLERTSYQTDDVL